MKHLKKYDTYEEFKSERVSLDCPWVTYSLDNKKVEYSSSNKKGIKFVALEDMTLTMSHTGTFEHTTYSCYDNKGRLLTNDLENNVQNISAGDVNVY